MRLLLIDNYDSFTFNLLHYLLNAGAEVEVVRNDELGDLERVMDGFQGAVLSPGPCTPREAGKLMEFVALYAGKNPILGVCLGMQALGLHYGWDLHLAEKPVHGKPAMISHAQTGIFEGLPQPMQVGRYHSLVISDPGNTPLKVVATCGSEVMAVHAESEKVWAVQFHPESILTPEGQELINRWIHSLG